MKSNWKTAKSNSALQEFFLEELKDMHWAEQALVKTLPKMGKKASSPELKKAFQQHLHETEGHVKRLDKIFELLGEKPASKKCEAMAGLIKEGESVIQDYSDEHEVLDVALIVSAQKCEHYEISGYGSLRTIANVLGYTEIADLLQQTLEEESATDELLTEVAEAYVNEEAVA